MTSSIDPTNAVAPRPGGEAIGHVASFAREGVLEIPGRFDLHHGGSLEPARIAYRLAGPAGAPVVAALGGISAGRYVMGSERVERGWWQELVGPGRALDSERYRILGIDYLGSSGESSGPRAGESWPSLSSYDQARALLATLNHLAIGTLKGIAGASYGGMVALAFAERFPERVARLLVISAADRPHPMATAWRSLQRRIVRFALEMGEGREGLKLARALAMATYRSPEEFSARFRAEPRRVDGEQRFPVEDYLFARGEDYADRYRPESYLRLSESIDLHSVDAGRIVTPTTLVAVHEDQLVPIADVRALRARLAGPSELIEVTSIYGHDAFLKEGEKLRPIFTTCLEGIDP